ncbi:hypothetical protein GGTG_08991 [Gaeumannomyces tritici R3-111a-1]|uniref:Uncharacterized protein n=1 Tax=Gaeumannomyces tritici (strain R3-111a-1) TaxID=644352 RepID=J3P650_GAET3|nr:hypothetical protein GGTG_08991 [Gaeumannomyces tritici R3-111a-1]EJT72123.1 hypothetical protein GGTG_08991 [Gaeumannomyces tritici R3-111a-1]
MTGMGKDPDTAKQTLRDNEGEEKEKTVMPGGGLASPVTKLDGPLVALRGGFCGAYPLVTGEARTGAMQKRRQWLCRIKRARLTIWGIYGVGVVISGNILCGQASLVVPSWPTLFRLGLAGAASACCAWMIVNSCCHRWPPIGASRFARIKLLASAVCLTASERQDSPAPREPRREVWQFKSKALWTVDVALQAGPMSRRPLQQQFDQVSASGLGRLLQKHIRHGLGLLSLGDEDARKRHREHKRVEKKRARPEDRRIVDQAPREMGYGRYRDGGKHGKVCRIVTQQNGWVAVRYWDSKGQMIPKGSRQLGGAGRSGYMSDAGRKPFAN